MNIDSVSDKEVAKLEKKLKAVYLRAQSETQAKMEDYLRRFAVKDAIKQEQVKQGKITRAEYIEWREGQIAVGKLWQDKVDALAADYTNANRIAVGMLRNSMAGVFAENHNYAAYQLEHDTMLDLSFSLYDQNTVRNLVMNNPDVLPLPSVDIPKDQRWNRQKINSVITQAVLQGDSIPKIAQNLRKVADMNYKAAVRNARTSMTAAQNAGRVESYKHAKSMGIDLEQEWLATLDGRTRHSHRQLDGEKITVAKDKWHPAKFSNGCRYPGDPLGPPWEIYNCRCTLVAAVKGVDQSNAPRNSKLGGMSYEEWKNGHKTQPTQAVAPPVPETALHLQGIRAVLGDDYANAMETLLEFTEEPNVKNLYYKYGDRFDVVDDPDKKGGAFFKPSEGKVHMNAEYVSKGDDLHLPYQTAFHEFGHNIDWLAGRDAGGTYISVDYENGKLGKTIKSDWKQFTIDMFRSYPSEYLYGDTIEAQEKTFRTYVRYVDTGDGKYTALSHKLRNGEITMYEAMRDDELMQRVMVQMKKDWVDPDDVTIALLKREGMSISECGSMSDIIEYCTRKPYPLGVGHGSSYWKGNPDAGGKEFFAETLDGMAANPKSLEQMRRVFPNAVSVVEEMMEELTK